jgi:hypothetical protein
VGGRRREVGEGGQRRGRGEREGEVRGEERWGGGGEGEEEEREEGGRRGWSRIFLASEGPLL